MKPLIWSLRHGWYTMCSRRIYIVLMVIIPLASTFFFLNLMDSGLPANVPTAVVDEDHSSMSRQVIRSLGANQMLGIKDRVESFHDAVQKVRSGEVFGFFYIPENFEQDALGGRTPTLSYYCNLTYFVPGSLAFKGFKTVAVTTKGGMVQTKLVSAGMDEGDVSSMLQPMVIDQHPIGNPWVNYNYYLSVSFLSALLALLIMQITSLGICSEIKHGTSPVWVSHSGGSMLVAVIGKLMPQAVVWTAVGVAMEAILFKFCHFPLNNHAMHMILAMFLLVIASQGFALTICCIVPNMRISFTLCSIIGILTFSIAAFSYPVPSMYPAIGIFSYILPERYFFLIYSDQALNGIPIYFSRWYYVALLLFPLVGLLGLRRLKRHCLNPVYVP
ncbi:MAG: ABC transporter permease [Muribaculaceae bacterium]|nr:ABC transporter permease [Muribaculaceae bacterium]